MRGKERSGACSSRKASLPPMASAGKELSPDPANMISVSNSEKKVARTSAKRCGFPARSAILRPVCLNDQSPAPNIARGRRSLRSPCRTLRMNVLLSMNRSIYLHVTCLLDHIFNPGIVRRDEYSMSKLAIAGADPKKCISCADFNSVAGITGCHENGALWEKMD